MEERVLVTNIVPEIDQVVKQHLDKVYFDEMGTTHTYQDLLDASNSFAAWLDNSNIPAGSPIMFYGDHQFEMVAGFLGGLKSGHAYIPVETGSALPRMQSIINTAKPKLVVAVDDFPDQELDYDGQILNLFELQKIMANHTPYSLDHEVKGNEPFYILFTSGTTGSPKGIEISANNITTFANWMLGDDFKLPREATFLGQPPFSFDISHFYWLVGMLSGATVKAIPVKVVQNFGQLFKVLPDLKINVFFGTPSFAELLLLSPDFNAEKMPDLQKFVFCGEELTVSTVKRLFQKFPDAHIYNTYGPTEATVAVTSCEITKDMLKDAKRLPIGYDKPGVTTTIWDGDKQITEPGKHGEIIISGDSVAAGYLNNPEKTAKNFFKFNGQQSYRTGDAGYITADGLRHIIGRMDFQIKLHGFRVELDEVRSSLELSEYIKQAVAVPKYDKNGKATHLIAYVIAQPNDFDSDAELTKAIRDSLKDKIMDYMMPTQFIYVDSYPTSANGKIAVKELIAEANK